MTAYVSLLFAAVVVVVVAPHFARINASSYAINKRAIVARAHSNVRHVCAQLQDGVRHPLVAASSPTSLSQTHSNTFACSFSRVRVAVAVVGCLQQFRFGAKLFAVVFGSNFRCRHAAQLQLPPDYTTSLSLYFPTPLSLFLSSLPARSPVSWLI